MLLARFQDVAPARAALDLVDHDSRPDGVINSPRAQAVSGVSAFTTKEHLVRCTYRNAPTALDCPMCRTPHLL